LKIKINKKALLEEASQYNKLIELNQNSDNRYFINYISIYKKQFKTNCTKRDILRWLNNKDTLLLIPNKGFIRFKKLPRADKQYSLKEMKNKILFELSDLASISKGTGTFLIQEMFKRLKNIRNGIITTIPWNNNLINYYKKFNFKEIYPTDKKFPRVIMYRKIDKGLN